MSDTQTEISFKEPKLRKKALWKRWWVWVLAFFVIIIAAASGGNQQPTVTNPNTNNAQPATSPQQKPEDKEFKVGETIQLGDNKVTVNEVTKSNGNDFDKPKDGMEYVIVKVTIENAGKSNISYNPFDFKMLNSQGQLTDQAFTIVDSKTKLNSGELTPGGKVSGTVSFQQPKGDAKLQLQYRASFFSSKTIKINLQ